MKKAIGITACLLLGGCYNGAPSVDTGPDISTKWPHQDIAPVPWVRVVPSERTLALKDVSFTTIAEQIRYDINFPPHQKKFGRVRLVLVDYTILPHTASPLSSAPSATGQSQDKTPPASSAPSAQDHSQTPPAPSAPTTISQDQTPPAPSAPTTTAQDQTPPAPSAPTTTAQDQTPLAPSAPTTTAQGQTPPAPSTPSTTAQGQTPPASSASTTIAQGQTPPAPSASTTTAQGQTPHAPSAPTTTAHGRTPHVPSAPDKANGLAKPMVVNNEGYSTHYESRPKRYVMTLSFYECDKLPPDAPLREETIFMETDKAPPQEAMRLMAHSIIEDLHVSDLRKLEVSLD